jgi:hypothetical protein
VRDCSVNPFCPAGQKDCSEKPDPIGARPGSFLFYFLISTTPEKKLIEKIDYLANDVLPGSKN